MERHRAAIRRVTAVLLVTSVVLILPSLAEIGASIPFTLGLALATLALFLVRGDLADAPSVVGYDLGTYASDLWLAVALAAGALVVFPDATAAELQSLGGLAGLVAMLNYFLTPVYGFVYSLAVRIGRAVDSA
jgi:hypothetical protein